MTDKQILFNETETMLAQSGFTIALKDKERPWGGFFVIDENQAGEFANLYFPKENIDELKITQRLSPKILMVAPHMRLSWQYHHRRAEIWKCIKGTVGVITSDTDKEQEQHTLHIDDVIKLKQGERHRLIGLQDWGIVAEIWQHTDETHPSDEDDIIRLEDDFGR
jgi:mannose-6-phosphate isomerase-like protein (cupin superfamily)